jgi:hypothetical protein
VGCCAFTSNNHTLPVSSRPTKSYAAHTLQLTIMDSAKDQEPLLSEEETPDQQNASQHISTPPPEASPEQIRTYLTCLLTTKRKLPEDYVRPVVANWKIGSGQELRSYSPAMYLRIFGHEDGWIIYREVMLAKRYEEARAKTMLQRNWICKSLHDPCRLSPPPLVGSRFLT